MRPENKVDLGSVQVHKRVLADIASAAVAEIEGVTMAHNDPLEGMARLFGFRVNSAVEVIIDPRRQVRSLIVHVTIRYGMNLTETSRRIQDAVMTAVEKMADINLKDVDVSIEGIDKRAGLESRASDVR